MVGQRRGAWQLWWLGQVVVKGTWGLQWSVVGSVQQHQGRPRRNVRAYEALEDPALEFEARLAVVEALRGVEVEDSDVVSKGWVSGVMVEMDSLKIDLELPGTMSEGEANEVASRCDEAATAIRDCLVAESKLGTGCEVKIEATMPRVPATATTVEDETRPESLQKVGKVLAVASCKGGVGKSTVATNVAFALKELGLKVGLCDVDVYGPSLPVLAGPLKDPRVKTADEDGELLEPFEKGGVKMMSFGFLNDAAAMMRGSRVSGVVDQLARRVAWRDLDVLVVDTPPGTGDAQLTLCQSLPIDGALVVTTPSRLAFADVVKGIDLFDTVNVPVLAVVENMAAVAPSADDCKRRVDDFLRDRPQLVEQYGLRDDLVALLQEPTPVFGPGFERQLRDMWGIDVVERFDLLPDLSKRADSGQLLFLADHDQLTDAEKYAKTTFLRLASDLYDQLKVAKDQQPDVSLSDDGDFVVSHRGQSHLLPAAQLRAKCRCAACIQDPPDLASIPPSLKPAAVSRTGNYALSIAWNDGHQSLLPFKAFVPAYAANDDVPSSPLSQEPNQQQPSSSLPAAASSSSSR